MFFWVSAEVYQQRGELDEALKAIRESVKVLDNAGGKSDVSQTMSLAHVLIWEGKILGQDDAVSMGRSEDAALSLERAFQIVDEVVHQDSNDQNSRARLGMAGNVLAGILRHSDAGRALTVYDHTLRHLAEIQDNLVIRRLEVEALAGSSYALRGVGRSAEASQRLNTAFEKLKKLKLYPAEKVTSGSVTYKTLRAFADFQGTNGKISEAIESYQKLIEQIQAAKLDPENVLQDALDLSNIYDALDDLHRRAGQADAASLAEDSRLELWRRWDRKLPNNSFVLRQIAAKSTSQSPQKKFAHKH